MVPARQHIDDLFGKEASEFHRALMARICNGDTDSLARLYEDLFVRIYAIAFRIVRDHSTASEVVQDTFVRTWRKASAFDPERGEVFTWVSFICRSVAIDAVRRRMRQSRNELSLAAEMEPFEPNRTAPLIPDHHLAQLTEAQRQALELAYFDDLSQAQIAERMGVSVANVKNHLRRGLVRLRQAFASHG